MLAHEKDYLSCNHIHQLVAHYWTQETASKFEKSESNLKKKQRFKQPTTAFETINEIR